MGHREQVSRAIERLRETESVSALAGVLGEFRAEGLYGGDSSEAARTAEHVAAMTTERAARWGREMDPVAAAKYDMAVERARADRAMLARGAAAGTFWEALSGSSYGLDRSDRSADAYRTCGDFQEAQRTLTFVGSRIRHGSMTLGENLKKAIEATHNGNAPPARIARFIASELKEATDAHVADVSNTRRADLAEVACEMEPELFSELAYLIDVATPAFKSAEAPEVVELMERLGVPAYAAPGRAPEPREAITP